MNSDIPSINNRGTQQREVTGVPWTLGDVAKGVGMAIGLAVVIGFVLVIITFLTIDIEALASLDSADIGALFELMASRGVLNQWLGMVLVVMVLGECGMLLAAWLFGALKYRCGWRALGFRRFRVGAGLVAGALVVVAGLVIGVIYDVLLGVLGVEAPASFPPQFGESSFGLAIIALTAVIVAPIAEEVFFRGFVLPGIKKRLGYVWAIVLSALLFALAHMQLSALPPIFILGLLLAWLYIRTGSIWPCILAHFAYNSIALLFMV